MHEACRQTKTNQPFTLSFLSCPPKDYRYFSQVFAIWPLQELKSSRIQSSKQTELLVSCVWVCSADPSPAAVLISNLQIHNVPTRPRELCIPGERRRCCATKLLYCILMQYPSIQSWVARLSKRRSQQLCPENFDGCGKNTEAKISCCRDKQWTVYDLDIQTGYAVSFLHRSGSCTKSHPKLSRQIPLWTLKKEFRSQCLLLSLHGQSFTRNKTVDAQA